MSTLQIVAAFSMIVNVALVIVAARALAKETETYGQKRRLAHQMVVMASQFDYYGRLHANKGTEDGRRKSAANYALADSAFIALDREAPEVIEGLRLTARVPQMGDMTRVEQEVT